MVLYIFNMSLLFRYYNIKYLLIQLLKFIYMRIISIYRDFVYWHLASLIPYNGIFDLTVYIGRFFYIIKQILFIPALDFIKDILECSCKEYGLFSYGVYLSCFVDCIYIERV